MPNEITMLQPNLTPEENIRRIYGNPEWAMPIKKNANRESLPLFAMPEEPLSQLLAWYKDENYRSKRKVADKLCSLFLSLPPEEQHEVGIALLGGRREDSRFVCEVLNDGFLDWNGDPVRWDLCYAQAVEECWNRHHDWACGKLLAQRLDEEIVKRYWNELSEWGHYLSLYERFMNEPWFELDKDELKLCTEVNKYLSILLRTGVRISYEEARLIMFQWIALLLDDRLQPYELLDCEAFRKGGAGERQIINIPKFDKAMWYLLSMKLDKVVEEILELNELVRSKTKGCNDRALRKVAIENFPEDLRFLLYNYYDTDGWVEYRGQRVAMPKWFPGCTDPNGYVCVYFKTYGRSSEDEEEWEEDEEEWYDRIVRDPNVKHLMQAFDLELEESI